MKNCNFQNLLQKFFLDWLMNQKKVSSCTIDSYKDTFRIFLKYLNDKYSIKAGSVTMENINADVIIDFLDYLKINRKNKSKTINNRLAAIKSFMEYVSYEAPEFLDIIRRIKALPFRNIEKNEVLYLTKNEIDSMLNVCNNSTSSGRRDYLMIILLYNSGMRVSEMISLQGKDITISSNKCYLRIIGKGRKERTIPLWKTTTNCIIQYIHEHSIQNNKYLLSGRNVDHLTRSGVRYRIDSIRKKALDYCPSLKYKPITPHILRHSTAMSLLQSGVDISTIAIWLGHESIETTHKYMVADMKLKENALNKVHEPTYCNNNRYSVTDDILKFLNSL